MTFWNCSILLFSERIFLNLTQETNQCRAEIIPGNINNTPYPHTAQSYDFLSSFQAWKWAVPLLGCRVEVVTSFPVRHCSCRVMNRQGRRAEQRKQGSSGWDPLLLGDLWSHRWQFHYDPCSLSINLLAERQHTHTHAHTEDCIFQLWGLSVM